MKKKEPYGFPVCGSSNAHEQSPVSATDMRFCMASSKSIICLQTAKSLARLYVCAGSLEPSLIAHVISMLCSCGLYVLCYEKTLFLMTDSICHSSLLRTVLEKVYLTTIQFRIYPRTKVDPMFQCVYISTPLKSCPYKSSATCA